MHGHIIKDLRGLSFLGLGESVMSNRFMVALCALALFLPACDGVDEPTIESDEIQLEQDQPDDKLAAEPDNQADQVSPAGPDTLSNGVNPVAACLMCEDLQGDPCAPNGSLSPECAWWITAGYCSGLDQLSCSGGLWQ